MTPEDPPKNIAIKLDLDSITVPADVPKQSDSKDEAERTSLELERKKYELDALNTVLTGLRQDIAERKKYAQYSFFLAGVFFMILDDGSPSCSRQN